jgi:para-nitrobenzyl esterase
MLRFRSPGPAPTWQGERSAREFGAPCPQIGIGEGAPALFGEEDCLSLNVHVPHVEAQKLPVLVWIHGGGRRVGDARRDVSAFVRDTQTIVVSIQYRLDHLAFLAHPALTREDPARLASGNYGFEDAIAALEWVRDEVAAFGGDPERVTIAGLSGGGTMVCGLMVSPHAAGLFQRAIVQSGGGCWFPTESIELGERRGDQTAAKLGCAAEEDAAACLRAQDVGAFFEAGSLVDNPFPLGSSEWFGAQPLLGGRSGHLVDGHVFPRSWPSAFEAGAFQRVPTMIGVTEHEGRRVYAELLYAMGAPVVNAASYPRALTGLTGSEALGKATARHFPLGPGGGSPAERFADVATDAHYTCPHAELAAAVARHAPTWLYQFRVAGPRRSEDLELGAYHGVDTELLFGADAWGPLPTLSPEQRAAARTLRAYVANFMRNGDPNSGPLPSWPAHGVESGEQHLDFSADPHASVGLRERACRYWRHARWEMLPGF